MTAPYKIAVAAAATLLLIALASLLGRGPVTSESVEARAALPAAADRSAPERGPRDTPPPPSPPSRPADASPPPARLPFAPPPRAGGAAAGADPNPGPATRLRFGGPAADPAPAGDPINDPTASDAPDTLIVGRQPLDETGRPRSSLFEPARPARPAAGSAPAPGFTAESPAPRPAATPTDLIRADPPASAVAAPVAAAAPPPAEPAAASEPASYTIAAGDSFSSIALELYGSANLWDEIAQANPLVDPTALRVGQVIRLPDRPSPGNPAAAPDGRDPNAAPDLSRGTPYTVKENDTLSGIAKQFYGASSKWELVYQANRRVIGDDPGRVRPGTTLTLPPPDAGAR